MTFGFGRALTKLPSLRAGLTSRLLGSAFLGLSLLPLAGLQTVGTSAQAQTQTQDQAPATDQNFSVWLAALKQEALSKGISQGVLDSALKEVEPLARVIELDRRQPEFTLTFWTYLNRAVNEKRVEKARGLMAKHASLLAKTEKKYGVQARFLVSFWGLESNFGSHTGGFSVITALTTLAYDERRSAFFRAQLLDALKIIDSGDIAPAQMSGSWAGAMGQVQFIPSTFRGHAVDADGDGRRDLWNSHPDIFASAANFLSNLGWDDSETWGREVRLPSNFDLELVGFEHKKPIGDWQKMGVRRADGRDLPSAAIEGSLVLPSGHKGPAFLVYGNFRATLKWNNSILYAIAVGHLADRIAGKGKLLTEAPENETPLRRSEIEEIQALLNRLGHDVGKPDGVAGRQTRAGIKAFQRKSEMPADGYPDSDLLKRLRSAAASG
ncbi:lytic murein transglycosylase [Pelagibius sp. Alg239-R121]|uniref:lytic murein transglycosylase n=1 Tax=Pelagibius sp. Alg239-R121 TaxID=2993448 RepID=UPI0024A6146A|nr:lytic murein transglycosylase [Pelagibius sp. Alg239-R121]